MALLTTRKVTKRFGGLVAVDNLDVEIRDADKNRLYPPIGGGLEREPCKN